MRRLAITVIETGAVGLVVSRRHARRRQLHNEGSNEVFSKSESQEVLDRSDETVIPDVSSLRSEGILAPPATTSLDKIRSELAVMRAENMKKAAEAKAAREQRQWLESQKEKKSKAALLAGAKLGKEKKASVENLTSIIQREYANANKPNDVFQNGKEVLVGVAQRSFLLQQKRLHDTDEVLRKSGKEDDTKRFVKLAFAPTTEQTSQLVGLLQRMRGQWLSEKNKLSTSSEALADVSDEDKALAQVAWLQVFEQLSDAEVHLLWESNILDCETLESLFADQEDEVARVERLGNAAQDATQSNADASPSTFLLDEKIDYVQRLHYLQEITSSIRETELGGAPSIDLAPTLVKVQRRQFADITEEELRHLERYSESAAMRLSVPGKASSAQAEAGSGLHAQSPKKKSPVQIDVPASLLDRALTPSNTFLSAVAEKDSSLKRSLEGMERIKREALLDPEFQEAVRFAHAVEEASVASHLHGQSITSGSSTWADEEAGKVSGAASDSAPQRIVSKRERRAARSRQFRGPMARSPYSPEVVPYFYNDLRSIVPPRGAFNLPDPTPTKAERAERRGRRRRAFERSRFRK